KLIAHALELAAQGRERGLLAFEGCGTLIELPLTGLVLRFLLVKALTFRLGVGAEGIEFSGLRFEFGAVAEQLLLTGLQLAFGGGEAALAFFDFAMQAIEPQHVRLILTLPGFERGFLTADPLFAGA